MFGVVHEVLQSRRVGERSQVDDSEEGNESQLSTPLDSRQHANYLVLQLAEWSAILLDWIPDGLSRARIEKQWGWRLVSILQQLQQGRNILSFQPRWSLYHVSQWWNWRMGVSYTKKYKILFLISTNFQFIFRNAFKQNGGRIVSVKVIPRSIQHTDREKPDCSNSQPLEIAFAPIQEGKQLEITYTYSVTFVSWIVIKVFIMFITNYLLVAE